MNKWLHPLLLLFIVSLLAIANYTPGTFLTGWDNVHTEFDFWLNIKRSIFSAWQEYQGLGLPSGTGYASDLPRQLFLWLLSFVVPINVLRYLYHFLMLFAGSLGVYVLCNSYVFRTNTKNKSWASFVAAVFYLFNLATVQMFFVPFEPFSHHYAALPWLLFANLSFVHEPKRRSLALLFLINILALPQGYVATYFLATAIVLAIVFIGCVVRTRTLRPTIIAALVFISTNAYWLLPNLYFVLNKTSVSVEAKINQMSTEDNFLKNKKYGNLQNAMLFKGFWFDNVEQTSKGEIYQMEPWIRHMNNPFIPAIGYSIFLLAVTGIFISVRRKSYGALMFLPIFLLSFTLLANDTPLLESVANLFYEIPLFSQIFRFPFTKFAVPAILCLSIFYAVCTKTAGKKALPLFLFLPIFFTFPLLTGNLFDAKNKLPIPKEYFEVINFFRTQPDGRIANFPQYTYWGWSFYRWGYRGSGILWYGIKQPILDRAFDVWSKESENYYHEMLYAVYSSNYELFEALLKKYQIRWILIDDSVVSFSSQKPILVNKVKEFRFRSPHIRLAKTFGKIAIYEVDYASNVVFLANNLPIIEPSYTWNNFDRAYLDHGPYVSCIENCPPRTEWYWGKLKIENSLYYPFRSLFTGRSQNELEFVIEESDEKIVFKRKLPKDIDIENLRIPESEDEVNVSIKDGTLEASFSPTFRLNVNSHSQRPNPSAAFPLQNLPTRTGYFITVEHRNITGKPLLFWLENVTTGKADIETYLPKSKKWTTSYFIQPPMEEFGLGYTLHFDNDSIGREESINDLGSITITPIPYEFLTSLTFNKETAQKKGEVTSAGLSVSHPNPSLYSVQIRPFGFAQDENPKSDPPAGGRNSTLVLSQSFDTGWKAYKMNFQFSIFNFQLADAFPFLFGKELKEHVVVNNWANGWLLSSTFYPQSSTVIILYLPQYLQYFGFLMLPLPLLLLLLRR